MADFLRQFVDLNSNFIRGAARIMWAGTTIAMPTGIASIINLSLYDPAAGWNDLGATKTGITITVNNTEETFDVDQIYADLDARPTGWECTVATSLAEVSLARLQFAWEGSGQGVGAGAEATLGIGQPLFYTKRRLAVLFQRQNLNIRAFVFRIVQRTPQESALSYNKTGEQQSIPVRFRALADTSLSDIYSRYFTIFDQQGFN
jgi:hypothetical protein